MDTDMDMDYGYGYGYGYGNDGYYTDDEIEVPFIRKLRIKYFQNGGRKRNRRTIVFENNVFHDERGYFMEFYNEKKFKHNVR